IRYSEAKNRWIGRVMVGYRPDGRPDIREVTAKQQGECRKKLDAIKARMSDGTLGDVKAGRETVALTPEGAAAMIETPVLTTYAQLYSACRLERYTNDPDPREP